MEQDNNEMSSVRITGATAFGLTASHELIPYTEPNWQACGPTEFPDDSFMRLRGLELLKQYVTLVHMWNYVVSQNNSSTEIQIAPEDTAGFVVQTKRSLPSCSNKQTISCTIDIDVTQGPNDLPLVKYDTGDFAEYTGEYKLSVYLPSYTLEFKPFKNTIANQCQPGQVDDMQAIDTGALALTTYDDTVVPIIGSTNSLVRNTHKTLSTGDMDAKVAGTYVARVKVLPFIYGWLVNGAGEVVDIRGSTQSAAGTTASVGPEGDITYSFVSGHNEAVLRNPTEAQYLQAKTMPTRSVPFKMLWDVVVTWSISNRDGSEPQTYTQTYQYMCNAVRVYYGVNMDPVTLAPLLPVTPPEPTVTVGGE
jgi:hypothetical protein